MSVFNAVTDIGTYYSSQADEARQDFSLLSLRSSNYELCSEKGGTGKMHSPILKLPVPGISSSLSDTT